VLDAEHQDLVWIPDANLGFIEAGFPVGKVLSEQGGGWRKPEAVQAPFAPANTGVLRT